MDHRLVAGEDFYQSSRKGIRIQKQIVDGKAKVVPDLALQRKTRVLRHLHEIVEIVERCGARNVEKTIQCAE
jgi:hypothetical protein